MRMTSRWRSRRAATRSTSMKILNCKPYLAARSRVTRLLAAKYGLQFKAFMLIERIAARGERRREVIHIVPRPPAAEADAG